MHSRKPIKNSHQKLISIPTCLSRNIAFNKKGTFTLLNQYKMVIDDWTHMVPYVTKEVYKISQLVNKNVRVFKQLGEERILAQTYRKDNITIGLRR